MTLVVRSEDLLNCYHIFGGIDYVVMVVMVVVAIIFIGVYVCCFVLNLTHH